MPWPFDRPLEIVGEIQLLVEIRPNGDCKPWPPDGLWVTRHTAAGCTATPITRRLPHSYTSRRHLGAQVAVGVT